MRVLIDADGCPVVRETVRQCAAFHVPCLLFCDTAHVFSIPGVEVFVADCGHDNTDYLLLSHLRPGDVVITQDYGRAYQKVDTILMPASPRTAFKFGEISDPTQMYLSDLYTISINICGNGGVSVPLGLGADTHLPVSAQLVGPAFKDRQLLTFARALERGFADSATGAPALAVAPGLAGKGGEL